MISLDGHASSWLTYPIISIQHVIGQLKPTSRCQVGLSDEKYIRLVAGNELQEFAMLGCGTVASPVVKSPLKYSAVCNTQLILLTGTNKKFVTYLQENYKSEI